MKKRIVKVFILLTFISISTSSIGMTSLCYYPNSPWKFSHIVAFTVSDWFAYDKINHVTDVYYGWCGFEPCRHRFQKTVILSVYGGAGQWEHNFYAGDWPYSGWFTGANFMTNDSGSPTQQNDACGETYFLMS